MLEIKKNNTTVELRNLQEQVQKNKEDIAKHYEIDRVLANVGMRIIGILPTPESLPDPLTYTGEYGDTYAVGYDSPYEYYIFTKANPNSGYTEDHWLDIGPLTIQGAQGIPGPRGEVGPQGTPGTKWREGSVAPSKLVTDREGDFYLNVSTGDVYKFSNLNWSIIGSIKGPQGIRGLQGPQGIQGEIGPQGPQGEKGDATGYISIAGILNNSTLLPSPSSIDNLSSAYLVGESTPYDLYIQVGDTSDNAVWQNVGPFNIGTVVTVNGEVQNTWNADTKLNKLSFGGGLDDRTFAYGQYYSRFDPQERQIAMPVQFYDDRPYVGHIPVYSTSDQNITEMRGDGYLYIKNPISDFHAANKVYVDSTIQTAIDNIEVPIPTGVYVLKETEVIPQNAGYDALYGFSWDLDGIPNDSIYLITDSPMPYAVTRFGENATLQTNNPVNPLDCVNKQYADGTYLSKITTTTNMDQVYVKATNGSQTVLNVLPNPSSGTSGVISKAYADGYLASKEYVNDNLNTKLDKVTSTSGYDDFRLYAIDNQGNQKTIRTTDNSLIVATKEYVDDNGTNKHLRIHNIRLSQTISNEKVEVYLTICNGSNAAYTTFMLFSFLANMAGYAPGATNLYSATGTVGASGTKLKPVVGLSAAKEGTTNIQVYYISDTTDLGSKTITSSATIEDKITYVF